MAGRAAAVVGAGVIGLTTAVAARRAGFQVTVYSDRPVFATTSAKAAASFKPSSVDYDPRIAQLSGWTWEELECIMAEFGAAAGLRKHLHVEASSSPIPPPPYLDLMEEAVALERPDVPGGYAFAWRYRTFFIDTTVFLPWLVAQARSQGIELVEVSRAFTSLSELAALPGDIVFNCTGLGARELCGDTAVVPVKGQVAIVDPVQEMDWSIKADGFYVYPRTRDTVLGATEEWGAEDEQPERGAVDAIVRANRRILPELSVDQVRRVYAGRRPYRQGGVRLECELVDGKPVVHNYGHGGAGFTLCWGSARAALSLA